MYQTKYKIDFEWRECTICNQYKLWNNFTKDKNWIQWMDAKCRECKRKIKIEYRKTYMGKIKEKNYRIIKRIDPEYRKKQYEKYKDWYKKNKDRLNEYSKKISQTEKVKAKRKEREYLQFCKWSIVIFRDEKCKIIETYKKWIWVNIIFNWKKMVLPKCKLIPYEWK